MENLCSHKNHPIIEFSFCHLILFCLFSPPSFLVFFSLGFLHISGGESAITSGSDADFRSERDTGEILDTVLLLHVLCGQLLWQGIS